MKNTNRIPIGIIVLILVIIGTTIFAGFASNNRYEITPESIPTSSSNSETPPINSEKPSIIDYYHLNISQPTPITQKLEFVQNDEAQVKEVKITTEYDGTCAITLSEVYQDAFFELGLYDEFGNKCSQVTSIDDAHYKLEYDGVKAGKYVVKVKYYGHGTPSCLLTIYKANKPEDISEYINDNGVIISDSFSFGFMRNYYSASVKENSTYLITSDSGLSFEIDILDKYGKCVRNLNGLQKNTEVNLESGDYTFDIHCCCEKASYEIQIIKKR